MPAPPMMDLGSGMNVQDTIQKLLELERIPLQRMQADNQLSEIKIHAWEETRNRVIILQEKSRIIYSFAGAFATRTVSSSDPGAITGTAAPNVEAGRTDIEVVQLATHHQVRSAAVAADEVLPAARFTIKVGEKEKEFQFRGGKIADLFRQLRNEGVELFDATAINPEVGKQLFSLRSKQSGERGRLVFADPDGLLARIGLTGGGEAATKTEAVEQPLAPGGLSAFLRDAPNAPDAKFQIATAPAGLELSGRGAFAQAPGELPKNASLSVRLSALEAPPPAQPASNAPDANSPASPAAPSADGAAEKPADSAAPDAATPAPRERASIGPDIAVQVGDVELRGYNIERERSLDPAAETSEVAEEKKPEEKPAEPQPPVAENAPVQFGVGVVYMENGELKRREVLRDMMAGAAPEEVRVDLGGLADIKQIYFFTMGGRARFDALMLRGEREVPAQAASNETTPARDALLRINGVEVRRPDNMGLTDVMQGVSLNLNRATSGPVQIQIEVNSDDIVKQITEWVQAYNELALFLRENAKSGEGAFRPLAENEQPRPEALESRGIFAADATIRQLIAGIRMSVAQSYPSTATPAFRVLNDIGIHSGEVGQSWEDIQYGLLQVNEEKLRQVLGQHPESVRELFASDSNEDNLPDSGVAVSLEKLLAPYSRRSGGLISARIDVLKDQIRATKERMANKELAIKDMEDKLRQRFGRMERMVQQNRQMGDYLRRNSPSAGQ